MDFSTVFTKLLLHSVFIVDGEHANELADDNISRDSIL
jgi:hypothetical protein